MPSVKILFFSIVLFFTSILLFSFNDPNLPSGVVLSRTMFQKTKEIRTMIFTMKKLERIKGKVIEQVSFVKLARNPYKVYSRQIAPKEGIEVLYIDGDNNALINPNGFPWMNLKLDPYGSIMRKDQHHTIKDSGYDLVIAILEYLFEKYDDKINGMVTNKGLINHKGDSCYVVEMNNPDFKFINYRVKAGEDVISIANRLMLSEHMIVERNDDIDDFYDVEEGQVIKIPNFYSPKIILYIDAQLLIPRLMKIYDDQGLYEQYEYNDLVINPHIAPEEFTPEYEEYGF